MHFTDDGADAIGRITPSGSISEFSSGLTDDADLRGITTGADGRLWFAEAGIEKIGRMTVAPSAGAVTASAVTETAAMVSSAVTPNSEATSFAVAFRDHDTGAGAPVATGEHDAGAGAPVGPRREAQARSFVAAGGRQHRRRCRHPGTVSFRIPGSANPIELRDGATIPSGSVIDTRKGTISLESALDSSGRSQTAKFRGAVFRMTLSRRDAGVVDIRLTQAPTGCPSRRFAARAARASSKAPIKLWSQDRKGKYRTRGRNSVAIVRGTEWTTAETCAGTLTRVIKGSVSVSDRRTGKKKLVRAAHTHLARSRSELRVAILRRRREAATGLRLGPTTHRARTARTSARPLLYLAAGSVPCAASPGESRRPWRRHRPSRRMSRPWRCLRGRDSEPCSPWRAS